MQHTTIYREPGRFAGWPANYGIWSWGDEIVVGFTVGYRDPAGGFHARDTGRPFVAVQARSLDGGEHWQIEHAPWPTPGNRGVLSADEHVLPGLRAAQAIAAGLDHTPAPCSGGVDFTHPDFALMCARTGLGRGAISWFYTSTDRCRTWQGPHSLPDFGLPGVEARTDYLVSGPRELMLFLTASKADGGEGAGIFTARTTDGGRTFALRGWAAQAEHGFTIMPSSVRLPSTRILTAVRCRGDSNEPDPAQSWFDLYASDDAGRTFTHLAKPVASTGRGGNPPALLRLRDGRLCLLYGHRAVPFGIRAVVSNDDGATWQEPVILRDDGGNHDLGYPRAVERADGAVVAVYYTNDHADGERYVAATIWHPGL